MYEEHGRGGEVPEEKEDVTELYHNILGQVKKLLAREEPAASSPPSPPRRPATNPAPGPAPAPMPEAPDPEHEREGEQEHKKEQGEQEQGQQELELVRPSLLRSRSGTGATQSNFWTKMRHYRVKYRVL